LTQKSEETEDLRIQRTRKLIQNAFIELTVEKGFTAVTVQDITKRAMVNRSTFYRHYLDKYDLLDHYLDEVYALIATAETSETVEDMPGGVPAGLVSLLKHVQANADFYRIMLGVKGDPLFTQRFRQNVEKRFRYLISLRSAETKINGIPVDLRVSYISYADIGAILWWLENDQPCSPEQLAGWLSQLTTANAGFSMRPHNDSAATG